MCNEVIAEIEAEEEAARVLIARECGELPPVGGCSVNLVNPKTPQRLKRNWKYSGETNDCWVKDHVYLECVQGQIQCESKADHRLDALDMQGMFTEVTDAQKPE